jgi:pimeloyl-ACP methyl ester carboxylesterase
MTTAKVGGLTIAYEIYGETGRPWILTPGGRFTKEDPGIREFAEALAERGNRAIIWDRPNCGESSVCFEGSSESAMQADALAGLLRHLDVGPAVIIGGSGGARVSMLAAARHRDVAQALAVWWISGGVHGLLALAQYYVADSVRAAWFGGMEAVAELEAWQEVQQRNPENRQRILDQDRERFVATMEQWMLAYCPCGNELVPGLSYDDAAALDLPTLVFRSGTTDLSHRRETSEQIAEKLPTAQLVEPPWGDDEWNERGQARNTGEAAGLFVRWPLLAPILHDWANEVLA